MAEQDYDALLVAVGEKTRMFLRMQKARIAFSNRLWKLRKDGLPELYLSPLDASLEMAQKVEDRLAKEIEKSVVEHPFARYYLPRHKGIGAKGLAEMWAVLGSFERFPRVPSLWKMCGGQQINGKAVKRERGVWWGKGDPRSFSPFARTVMYKLADSACMGKNDYRKLYDKRRATVLARERTGPSGCPFGQEHRVYERRMNTKGENRKTTGEKELAQCVRVKDGKEVSPHVHADALRIVWKQILRDAWVDWQVYKSVQSEPSLTQVTPIGGLGA